MRLTKRILWQKLGPDETKYCAENQDQGQNQTPPRLPRQAVIAAVVALTARVAARAALPALAVTSREINIEA